MEAQANTAREQSNKNNIGWRPSHRENKRVGNKKKKKKNLVPHFIAQLRTNIKKEVVEQVILLKPAKGDKFFYLFYISDNNYKYIYSVKKEIKKFVSTLPL